MNPKGYLLDEDRGVSPVIGVILMVAITVILAAVIATFVMNMGPDQNSPANANWDWNSDSSDITLEHGGGAAADSSEYVLVADDGSDTDRAGMDTSDDGFDLSDSELTAGSTLTIDVGEAADSSDDSSGAWSSLDHSSPDDLEEVTLIWEDPDSDQTQIVDTHEP